MARQKWESRTVEVSFFYYTKTQYGMAQHKRGQKHMTISEVLEIVKNKNAILDNKGKLSGINGILIEEWNGENHIFQICGYNGNVGMYNYLVTPSNKLVKSRNA